MQKWDYDVGVISLDPGPPPYLDPFVGGPNECLPVRSVGGEIQAGNWSVSFR